MILLDKLDSIIESIYLNDTLTNKQNLNNIYVNPINIKYLTERLIIINRLDYSTDNIKTLLNNGCKIISRVFFDIQGINLEPYILNLNFNIMWNGKTQNYITLIDIVNNDNYDFSNGVLYFPKLTGYLKEDVIDNFNNLTALGWVLQQVGENIKENTKFINLDIIKTKRVL